MLAKRARERYRRSEAVNECASNKLESALYLPSSRDTKGARNPGCSAELVGCYPEVGLAVVTRNWYAIQHLPADLKADKEIAIAAVREMQMPCSLFLGLMVVLGLI